MEKKMKKILLPIVIAELKEIASWLYDNYPPANFRGRGMMNR